MKEVKIQPDEFKDGVRLFNPTKPHGTIYSDGTREAIEAKWDQDGILYRGDRTPIIEEKKLHWKTRQKLEAQSAHSGES